MQEVTFPSGKVSYLFNGHMADLRQQAGGRRMVLVTDENVAAVHATAISGYEVLTIPAGEGSKSLETVERLANQLLKAEVTRTNTLLAGIGGGVITDITGFLASVYMRGISFAFVPTTLLAMVDAAIGGKNGVNTGMHKNTIGTITQPEFLLYDTDLLSTLPIEEWSNGFAEVIKYACLFDPSLFEELQRNDLDHYRTNAVPLGELIERCATWKNKIVVADERETGQRKLLNFGHTAGHAIEKLYSIPHGNAVGIGMLVASLIAEDVLGLDKGVRNSIEKLLRIYGLPLHIKIDVAQVLALLKMDKKRTTDTIDFILLEQIGSAVIKPLPFDTIAKGLEAYARNY